MLIVLIIQTGCALPLSDESRKAADRLIAFSREEVPYTSEKVEYIGIISAMQNEIDLLLSQMDLEKVDKIGGVDYHVGSLKGQPVVIAKSGIGKVLASSGMTTMLNRYPISRVIFTGIAGGVGENTKVLDEVIATRLVQHDYGQITNNGFEWYEGYTGKEGYYYCDPDLASCAYEAAVSVLGKEHVFQGTIATGDQFIASEEAVKKLSHDFDAIACEMEGAAIAVVCEQYDIPFVVIRAMSDKADGKAHETYENMGDIAADNSSRIVLRMIETISPQSK
ncbi:MAG: 5'-methylthioadenosine/adenosylhomocysteine nucleosidase [Lachnospiraceae bacterium]|nr:5'-methylthioadenosine/adenosylhomocysteine nucleosidase [Lachnospiraceae bacterium]